MAESSTEFGKITEHVHAMAHGMEQTHQSSKQTADALGTVLKTVLGISTTLAIIEKAAAVSPLARSFKEALTTLGKTKQEIIANYDAEYERIHKLLDEKRLSRREAELEYLKLESRFELVGKQVKLTQEMNRLNSANLLILTGAVTVLSRLFYLNHELNDDLIKANSDWKTRYQLFTQNLQIQRETGVAFRTVTEAQKELVNYGMQSRRNYHDVLTTIVQLREGLGMSVHEATQLAVVTERQVKSSFKDTADIVATIVNNTSLAADEVGRLATNLGRAMAVIKPGGVQEFPQIVKLVGKYEDALKKFGGQVGQFEQLLSRMTRPEGLLSAGVLGISNPEQLLKTAGVDKAIDNFYKYATSQLAGARGFDRMFRLDILAEQFGTTAEQMNAMIQAIEDSRKAQSAAITVQERFKQQMQSTGEGFTRIVTSLKALAQGALYPVIVGINYLTNAVANFLQLLLKYKPVAVAAMIALDVGIIVAIVKLKGAARAFYEVVIAAQIASIKLREYAREQVASSLVGGAGKGVGAAEAGAGGLAGLGTRLVSTLNSLKLAVLAPLKVIASLGGMAIAGLSIIAAGLGAITFYAVKMWRAQVKMYESNIATGAKLVSMRDNYFETARMQIFMATRMGDMVKAQAVIDKVMKQIGSRRGAFSDLSERDAAVKQAQFQKDLQKLVPLAQYTATQFGNLRVTPEQNDAMLKESTDFQQKIAENTKKSIDEAKKIREQDNKNADEQRRQEELRYLRNGGVVGRGTGIYNMGPF